MHVLDYIQDWIVVHICQRAREHKLLYNETILLAKYNLNKPINQEQ